MNYKEVYLHAYETVSATQQGLVRYLTFSKQTRPAPDGVYADVMPTQLTAA